MRGRGGWSVLLALWLVGCGVYGPPERTASPAAPAAAVGAEPPGEECVDPEPEQ